MSDGFIVRREDDFDFLTPEYAHLYDSSDATPFQDGVWLERLYSSLASVRGAVKTVVTVRRHDDDVLVMVLPFVSRRYGPLKIVEFADLGVADYAAPVLDRDSARALRRDASIGRQVCQVLGPFDLLRIERVADAPEVMRDFIKGARFRRHYYSSHVIKLPGEVEAWRASLDPSFVRHLERKYKRLRPKGGSDFRIIDDVDAVDELMVTMQRYRAARFRDRRGIDLVQDPDYLHFYQAIARDGVIGVGPGRLAVLAVGSAPAAIALILEDGGSDLFVLVGYDIDRLRASSLGLLIVDQLIHTAIKRGQAHFDLTVGDEPYKADFGAVPRPLFEVYLARTPAGMTAATGHAAYLRARRLAKRVVGGWEAWRAARKKAST